MSAIAEHVVAYSKASSLMNTTRTVTERDGISYIEMTFFVGAGFDEAKALDHAERSFTIEDAGVYVTPEDGSDRFVAHAAFTFNGDHDAAVKFSDEVFIGTPNFRQLLREVQAVQDDRDAGLINY
jgi:hypothetical protein